MYAVFLASILYGFNLIDCAHIVTIEKDFNKVLQDKDLNNSVDEVVKKLRSFQLPVHPRVAAMYQILQKGMRLYAEQHAESLYMPHKYVVDAGNVNDIEVTTTQAANKAVTPQAPPAAPQAPPAAPSAPSAAVPPKNSRRIIPNRHPLYDEIMDK